MPRRAQSDCMDGCRLVPLARALRSPALKLRHWNRLGALLRCAVGPEDDKSLAALAPTALPHLGKISKVVLEAEEELSLEQQLDALQVRAPLGHGRGTLLRAVAAPCCAPACTRRHKALFGMC